MDGSQTQDQNVISRAERQSPLRRGLPFCEMRPYPPNPRPKMKGGMRLLTAHTSLATLRIAMQNYMVQKAQQALEALLRDAPLAERLRDAKGYILAVSGDDYLAGVSPELRENITTLVSTDLDKQREVAEAYQSVIEGIFEEWGREMERRSHQ